jgi:hypothetical protein
MVSQESLKMMKIMEHCLILCEILHIRNNEKYIVLIICPFNDVLVTSHTHSIVVEHWVAKSLSELLYANFNTVIPKNVQKTKSPNQYNVTYTPVDIQWLLSKHLYSCHY